MRPNFHVIKDPVHGTMQFTDLENQWVKPFIDSPHIQRLRAIKQLGMADLIFPGAVHTRFNHSLGCCYIASQIAQKIGLADEERQLVMIACLLHDIGHGPFSHAFEGIFEKQTLRHEAWTPYFLADYNHVDFFGAYNRLNSRHHLSEEKFHIIAGMIMHQADTKGVLGDIVSSQLDADRLDYLLRDSHFCGVKYGEFDFRWMLHCLTIIASPNGERLGITHKGLGTVEHYLMARRLMTRNIYHAQKKLALEVLLVKLLAYLAQDLEQNQHLFQEINASRLGIFLKAAYRFDCGEIDRETFLNTYFIHYQALEDADVSLLIKQLSALDIDHPAVQIASRLAKRIMPKIIRLEFTQALDKIKNKIDDFKFTHQTHFKPWQLLLIHTPHQSYSGEDDPILTVNERGEIRPISDFSLTIKAISDKLEQTTFLCIDKVIADDPRVVKLVDGLA